MSDRRKDTTEPQRRTRPEVELVEHQANRWKDLRNEFEQLAREQERLEPTTRSHSERQISLLAGGLLRAGGDYSEHPETGVWLYSGAVSDNLRERFRTLAARAGDALGPPKDTDHEDFWLHRLFVYLRGNNSDLLFAASDKGGMITHVCEASATFCTWLERQVPAKSEKSAPQAHGPEQRSPRGFDGLGKKKKRDFSEYFDFARLTERQRDCLSMKLEYELPITEIARRLDLDRKTVQEHIKAGEKRIERNQNYKQAAKRRAAHLGSQDE